MFLLRDVVRSYKLTFFSFFTNFFQFISISRVLLLIHTKLFCISTLKHVSGFLSGFFIRIPDFFPDFFPVFYIFFNVPYFELCFWNNMICFFQFFCFLLFVIFYQYLKYSVLLAWNLIMMCHDIINTTKNISNWFDNLNHSRAKTI